MSQPYDIPDDVWKAALNVAQEISPSAWRPASPRTAISRAILAERERCALIAEMHEHRGVIAHAIRHPQETING